MQTDESHLNDHELLLAADGELSRARMAHLSECWPCRVRKQETEESIAEFVRFHRSSLDPLLPSGAGPRALLRARLAELAAAPQSWRNRWPPFLAWRRAVAILCFAVVFTAFYRYGMRLQGFRASTREVPVSFPEPNLTPGAVVTQSREQVCGSDNQKNRVVPGSLRRRVFEEYGIPNAEPQAYEVDYLITPALGGADDIRNLWPQSTSAALWNAHVKDELEDRLRELVCAGALDLTVAQRDISSDWIAAYKKYFRTDTPLKPNH